MTNEQMSDVLEILDGARDATVATVREDGYPQATVVISLLDYRKGFGHTEEIAV